MTRRFAEQGGRGGSRAGSRLTAMCQAGWCFAATAAVTAVLLMTTQAALAQAEPGAKASVEVKTTVNVQAKAPAKAAASAKSAPAAKVSASAQPPASGKASVSAKAPAAAKVPASASAPPAAEVPATPEARMKETVGTLCTDDKDGRGPGSRGLVLARDYITAAFHRAGLTPGGEGGTIFQAFNPKASDIRGDFKPSNGKQWGQVTLANIVGVLPGTAKDAPCLVICAHYDHLGSSVTGSLYLGADDNASGVAVLLELAAQMRKEGPFRNTVVFAAFTGEEEGTLGANYYLAHPTCPLERTLAVLNLDTVGRMDGKKLLVLGTATAVEFPEIIKGVNLGVGLELVTPEAAPFSSDQVPFYEKGIPALHLFTGPNADYHKTTDTPDKLNYPGLVSVLDFARETAIFLAEREERLSFVPPGAGKAAPIMASGPPRRSSMGTIPDFGRESGGVLLTGTTPGSPAEHAGLAKGDIIVSVAGMPIDNLADLSASLKAHQPGDTVEVVFKRGDEERRLRVGIVERK